MMRRRRPIEPIEPTHAALVRLVAAYGWTGAAARTGLSVYCLLKKVRPEHLQAARGGLTPPCCDDYD